MVEMMVVLVIVAILSAIAVPLYLNQKKAANEVALKMNLRTVGTQVANSAEMIGDPVKTPVDAKSVPANSIDLTTHIPVQLSEGVSIKFKTTESGFCISGTHISDTSNFWSYTSDSGDVRNFDCVTGDGSSLPTTSPTTAPTTAPTTTPTTAPTTTAPTTAPSPSPSPTTTPTTAPSPSPSPTTTGPYLESYTTTFTAKGAKITGFIRNAEGKKLTLRASASQITTQTGFYVFEFVPSTGAISLEITDFTHTDPRYWQLELEDRSAVLASGLVSSTNTTNTGPSGSTSPAPTPSPSPTSTSPSVSSYTVTHTSGGATINALLNNASGRKATLRVSASPITTQAGYLYSQTIPTNGQITIASNQLKNTSPVYWQLELDTRDNILASGSVTTGQVVSGP